MNETRKAGITVSLVFVVPLLLVACLLVAARDDRPNAPVAPAPASRIAHEAPVSITTCDQICTDIEYQRSEDQRARARDAYRASEQLDEQIRDAANAAANAAVQKAMDEKSAYPGS